MCPHVVITILSDSHLGNPMKNESFPGPDLVRGGEGGMFQEERLEAWRWKQQGKATSQRLHESALVTWGIPPKSSTCAASG